MGRGHSRKVDPNQKPAGIIAPTAEKRSTGSVVSRNGVVGYVVERATAGNILVSPVDHNSRFGFPDNFGAS